MNETRELARFASVTGYQDLPAGLVDKAKIYILDNLAVGLVGARLPWTRIIADLARDLGGAPEASVFGWRWKTDVSRAAWVNGAAIGAFEFGHIGHLAHPSGTVFPAALALAERDHLDGKALLAATLVGYEVVCRIGEAQTAAVERERGFHNPSANGVFGAAAAAGRLLGLDEMRMTSALGIAGSSAGGLIEFVWEGSMTKRLHLGRASQQGLEAALLAERGFTGPSTVLEGRYGYFAAFSPRPSADRVLADLGRRWLAETLMIKAYPCHATGQAIVHAIQAYRRGHPVDAAAVRRVSIAASPRLAEARHLDPEPRTVLGAQYSLVYTVAVALARDMSDPMVFGPSVLEDPAIRELARRVDVRADAERFGNGDTGPVAEVTIEIGDTPACLLAGTFPGSLAHPLDLAGTAGKFYRCATPALGRERADAIVAAVRNLERLPDVAGLAGLISAEPGAAGDR